MSERDKAGLMAWHAACEIANGETAFVGIGAPGQAALIARRTHAPDINMIFESGVIGADPTMLPLSTGSPSIARGGAMFGSMLDVFTMLQQGRIDVGMLSAAEVDRRGNLNSTVIGPYDKPKVRLPGSGGAHDIAVLAKRLLILMPHDPQRFVEKVGFATSPGHPAGKTRQAAGLTGGGPSALVTPRALFRFDGGEMTLAAIRTDLGADDAVEGIPWQVPRRATIEKLPPFPADGRKLFPFLEDGDFP